MSREKILARVREALSVPTDTRFLHSREGEPPPDYRVCLPPGGRTAAERRFLLGAHLEALKAEFVPLPHLAAAGVWLHVKAVELGWKRAACHDGPLATPVAEALGVPLVRVGARVDPEAVEPCPVAITECDALVAQTGGILVTSRSAGGRALSVLSPHHVVIASADQVVADLPEAFDRLQARYGANPPSFVGFIHGASRTGDIERILVLGAHGPRRLTVLLVDSLEAPEMEPDTSP
jgi:L-lactate dehydrogenase complex protein LldG